MVKNIICISCPVGCPLTVTLDGNSVTKVEGNACPRGDIYARKECVNPTRILTTSVSVEGGTFEMLSVKTRSDIPKTKVEECSMLLKGIKVKAPVKIGDIIYGNIAGTGVDIIASRNVEAAR